MSETFQNSNLGKKKKAEREEENRITEAEMAVNIEDR